MDQKTLENQLKNCKIRQGPLYKRSKFLKQWRERWIVLTMNYLFTFTNKSCKEVTDIIDLNQLKSYKSYLRKDQEMIPAGFKVRSDDQEFYFCGRNCNQKWSWIVTLQRLMDYKYAGSSTYNNIQFIKTRGFLSQFEFQNGGKVQKSPQLQEPKDEKKKSAQEAKKQVDNQVQKIMKQLENQKLQLKQKQLEFTQKQKVLKQQQQALKKQEQEKLKELEKKVQQISKSPNKKVQQIPVPSLDVKVISQAITETVFGPKVSDLKNLYEQRMRQSTKDSVPAPPLKMAYDVFKNIKKKSVAEELHSLRSRTVTNLFEEFHNESPEPQALIFTLDFLVKMASDSKYGYQASIVAEAKSHKNKQFLAETFVEMLTDYKDIQNSDLIAKFIEICVVHVPGFFQQRHIAIIENKLIEFFLAVEDDTKLQTIMKNMFIVNRMVKFNKNETVKAKITKLTKEIKREQTKNWARKLIEEF